MRILVVLASVVGSSCLQFGGGLSSGLSLMQKAANYALSFSDHMKQAQELPDQNKKMMNKWEDLVHSTYEARQEHGPELRKASSLLQQEHTRLQNNNVTGNELIHGLALAIKRHGLEHRLNLLGKTMQQQIVNESEIEGLYVGIPYWHSFQFSMGIVGFPFSWWPNPLISSEPTAERGFINDDRAVIKLFSSWSNDICQKICIQLVWVTHYVITNDWKYKLFTPPFSNVEGGLLLGYGKADYPEGWGDGPSWTFRHGLLGDINLQWQQHKLAPMAGALFGHPFGIMGNIALPEVIMNPYLKQMNLANKRGDDDGDLGDAGDNVQFDRGWTSVMTGFGFYMAYTFCLPAWEGTLASHP